MSKIDILTRMYAKTVHESEFNYEKMMPVVSLASLIDIKATQYLANLAVDPRYTGNIKAKYKEIKNVMESYGFKRFQAGTNRVAYRHLEYREILTKVAVDKNGLQNNFDELRCQHFLKPFCSKSFEVSPSGSILSCEKVIPITSEEEFASIANDVFDIISQKFIGKYAINDFGSDFFMNWGFRMGFGPVLIDYPYVYPIDEDRLYCNRVSLRTGILCGGELDYDSGFNYIYCIKCGKKYSAKELIKNNNKPNLIVYQGGIEDMEVSTYLGDELLTRVTSEDPKRYIEPKRKFKAPKYVKPGEPFIVEATYVEINRNNQQKYNQNRDNKTVVNDQTTQVKGLETKELSTPVLKVETNYDNSNDQIGSNEKESNVTSEEYTNDIHNEENTNDKDYKILNNVIDEMKEKRESEKQKIPFANGTINNNNSKHKKKESFNVKSSFISPKIENKDEPIEENNIQSSNEDKVDTKEVSQIIDKKYNEETSSDLKIKPEFLYNKSPIINKHYSGTEENKNDIHKQENPYYGVDVSEQPDDVDNSYDPFYSIADLCIDTRINRNKLRRQKHKRNYISSL